MNDAVGIVADMGTFPVNVVLSTCRASAPCVRYCSVLGVFIKRDTNALAVNSTFSTLKQGFGVVRGRGMFREYNLQEPYLAIPVLEITGKSKKH
jgi:hypothetical protein